MIKAQCDVCKRKKPYEELISLQPWAKKSGATHLCRSCEKSISQDYQARRFYYEQKAKDEVLESIRHRMTTKIGRRLRQGERKC